MRVNTVPIPQYAIVTINSDTIMAIGMSRFGLIASSPVKKKDFVSFKIDQQRVDLYSPVVAMASNPMNP